MVAGQGNGMPSVMTSYAAISGKRMDKKVLIIHHSNLCEERAFGEFVRVVNMTNV
jgi:hypothetical protein